MRADERAGGRQLQDAPEVRGYISTASRAEMARGEAVNSILVLPMVAALILVALGLLPDRDAALYHNAIILGLFLAG